MTGLNNRLQRIRSAAEERLSSRDREAIEAALEALASSGQADRALGTGDRVPEFTIRDIRGRSHTSQDLLASGPLVINFFRGHWCPYCDAELDAMHVAQDDIAAAGGRLIAITPQTAEESQRMIDKRRYRFALFRDRGNEVAALFGLRWSLPEELVDAYRDAGTDLREFNGEDSGTLPIPATYVVDTDGVIRWSCVSGDYTRRAEPADVIEALEQIGRAD